jgi:hypothetical protein
MPGEHKVHPYAHPETICRGESCIRPFRSFYRFFLFSDSLSVAAPTGAEMKILIDTILYCQLHQPGV